MKKMLKIIWIVCLVFTTTTICNAEGLLPSLTETIGVPIPSIGVSLSRYPNEEIINEDGSETDVYYNITETDFNIYNEYLVDQAVTLKDYNVVDNVLHAEIEVNTVSFLLEYSYENSQAKMIYPPNAYDERLKNARTHYAIAVELITSKKFDDAYAEILLIPQYQDYLPAALLLEDANMIKAVHNYEMKPFYIEGNYVKFGKYPQSSNGDDASEIEWIVLEADEANHRSLLLSRYGLDAQPWHSEKNNKGVGWQGCTLRSWLNNDFLNKAFTQEEQSAILEVEINNDWEQGYRGWVHSTYTGSNTWDKVFLLSYAEAHKYLGIADPDDYGGSSDKNAIVIPTEYAISVGAEIVDFADITEDGYPGEWWLRSFGKTSFRSAAIVSFLGSLFATYHLGETNHCVRPALWIDLNSYSIK